MKVINDTQITEMKTQIRNHDNKRGRVQTVQIKSKSKLSDCDTVMDGNSF